MIVFSSNSQPIFMARADIFKNKITARVLLFLKLIPIYRIRDGKASLDKNQKTFETAFRILSKNKVMGLFPEGTHIGMKSMLKHKKAIPRIVFMAGEKSNYQQDIKIIPVGINYSHYYNFRRNATIRYGKPISSKEFYPLLKEVGEAKASIALRDRIFEKICELVTHVDDKPAYELYAQAFEMAIPLTYKKIGVKPSEKYFAEAEQYITSEIANALEKRPSEKEKLVKKATLYKTLKTKLNFSEKELTKGKISFWETLKVLLILMILTPFALYGAVTNGWLYYITHYPLRKKIEDEQFYSSFSYGLSFVLFPIWTIIHFFVVLALFKSWGLSFLLVVFSYASGILAWELGGLLIQTYKRFRYGNLMKKNHAEFVNLLQIRNELNVFYNSIID